jgi:type II secretory pathway pseudopilin PulG
LAKSRWTAERGFSLLETLVAVGIMTAALVALAQLFVVGTQANRGARVTTFTATLAQEKMEQLRGLTWGFDPIGLPLSDTSTDTSQVPESPTGGTGLAPSPAGTLSTNTAGYCDFLDANGKSLGGGSNPPDNTAFIRRWSIEPLPTDPNNTLVIQVLVTRLRDRGAADTAPGVKRLPEESRILSVKTRKAA